MIEAQYKVGDTVKITQECIGGNENYQDYEGQTLTVCDVSLSHNDHPGFDPGVDCALYDFDGFCFSLYEWEIEPV